MFTKRTIPPECRDAARRFALEALEAAAEARHGRRLVSARGGGATATAVIKGGHLRRYELRLIRRMMLDIFGT